MLFYRWKHYSIIIRVGIGGGYNKSLPTSPTDGLPMTAKRRFQNVSLETPLHLAAALIVWRSRRTISFRSVIVYTARYDAMTKILYRYYISQRIPDVVSDSSSNVRDTRTFVTLLPVCVRFGFHELRFFSQPPDSFVPSMVSIAAISATTKCERARASCATRKNFFEKRRETCTDACFQSPPQPWCSNNWRRRCTQQCDILEVNFCGKTKNDDGKHDARLFA